MTGLPSSSSSSAADSTPSSSSSSSSSSSVAVPCAICADKATGKHYGTMSCDGCKGFFRRTVRKRHSYVCRFSRACVVDKDHRNTCRRCRFERCLTAGMRREAVQQERDRIRVREDTTAVASKSDDEDQAMEDVKKGDDNRGTINGPPEAKEGDGGTPTGKPVADGSALEFLKPFLQAEAATRQLRSSVITRVVDGKRQQPATTGDVTDSMHQQLVLMVEWAKQIQAFRSLPMDTQIALLRNFSAQHLVACAAFRSINIKDAVRLNNETLLHKDAPKVPDTNRVAARIVDHLTTPMRALHMEEVEYVALKAVAFFDPLAPGALPESTAAVDETRQRLLAAFEQHVTRVSPWRHMPLRLANLLLLLPPMLAIARDLVEDVQLAKLFGLASIDTLMQELMLPDSASSTASATAALDAVQPPPTPTG